MLLGRRVFRQRDGYLLIVQIVSRAVTRSGPARSVACRSKSFLHAFLGAGQDVGICAHGATDEDWLACQLVVYWDQGMVRGKSPALCHRLVT